MKHKGAKSRKRVAQKHGVRVELNEGTINRIARKHRKEIEALAAKGDDDIDFSDIPEVTEWRHGVVGKYYRPLKAPITLRLDADVLAWLKSQGRGYQRRINSLLRSAMVRSAGQRKGA